jgi:hypothetical protein
VLVRRGGGSLDLECYCFKYVDHRPGDQECAGDGVVPKEQKQMVLASCFRCCRAPHVATQVLGGFAVAGGVRHHDGPVLLEHRTDAAGNHGAGGLRHVRAAGTLHALMRHTDSLPLVFQLTPPMLGKLQESFANPAPTAGGGPAGGNPPRFLRPGQVVSERSEGSSERVNGTWVATLRPNQTGALTRNTRTRAPYGCRRRDSQRRILSYSWEMVTSPKGALVPTTLAPTPKVSQRLWIL